MHPKDPLGIIFRQKDTPLIVVQNRKNQLRQTKEIEHCG